MARYLAQHAAFVLAICLAAPLHARDATVAVAANFLTTAQRLEAAFEAGSDHDITLAHGSTGRIYAQVAAGAPFDVFLAADADRPARLAREGLADAPVTYALGRLVLVTREGSGTAVLGKRVALADPAVAPYGLAAEQALASLGVKAGTYTRLLADSVGQTASLFATGNAEAAFIAAALLPELPRAADVTHMEGLHDPIRQDAVLLARGRGNPAATAFMAFLTSPEGRAIIAGSGFDLPQ